MKKLSVKAYLLAKKFSNVLENRKGASTVEYVAVLAGAAAIGMLLFNMSGDMQKPLFEKVKAAIASIGTGK
ncbi:hypothetical protein SAMN05444487_10782 [Marininema mesophilum]|uniref:Pilus assembly protein Flp/PilA n=1 Tax=Marininema mesophilum TaxID=1048340 RepID=A0A1H2X4Z4_9BACL|nr:hypothetical protein [Marininema mesophilum]SDW87816.1 hypothetical protein SAMN05444487_10782 [Marininema mesophilum]